MLPIRRARLESSMRDELATLISREIKDPRIPALTITSVQVTPDAEQATIMVMLFGAPSNPDLDPDYESKRRKQMKDCLQGLTSASGFMRRHMAKVFQIRHVPELIFKEDRGLENVTRVNELLQQISQEQSSKTSE